MVNVVFMEGQAQRGRGRFSTAWPGVSVKGFPSPAVCPGANQHTEGTEGHRQTDTPSERGPARAKGLAGAVLPVTLSHRAIACQPRRLNGMLSPSVCSTHPGIHSTRRRPLGVRSSLRPTGHLEHAKPGL